MNSHRLVMSHDSWTRYRNLFLETWSFKNVYTYLYMLVRLRIIYGVITNLTSIIKNLHVAGTGNEETRLAGIGLMCKKETSCTVLVLVSENLVHNKQSSWENWISSPGSNIYCYWNRSPSYWNEQLQNSSAFSQKVARGSNDKNRYKWSSTDVVWRIGQQFIS